MYLHESSSDENLFIITLVGIMQSRGGTQLSAYPGRNLKHENIYVCINN